MNSLGEDSPPRPIRTPDQKLRVFVSSTLKELAEERRAARSAIERLHLAPVMFELGARPHPPRDLYRAYLGQSDLFVGLYWERYGWVAPGEEVSGLEDEYNLAPALPKLIYIRETDGTREPRLTELLDRIRTDDTASFKYFSSARELGPLLTGDLDALPATLDTREERMALVHRLADRNWRESNGGPFAAIVVEATTGRLVSVGVNVVLASGISAAHAEVMALGLAQRATGSWDLGADPDVALQLVVNWRPCVMCYGATMWSGIRELVVAGSGSELETLTGFDEGPMREDWAEQFEARGIRVTQDIGRDEALRVFRAYGDADAIVYNARGGITVT